MWGGHGRQLGSRATAAANTKFTSRDNWHTLGNTSIIPAGIFKVHGAGERDFVNNPLNKPTTTNNCDK